MCVGCANKMKEKNMDSCPTCRAKITKICKIDDSIANKDTSVNNDTEPYKGGYVKAPLTGRYDTHNDYNNDL
jgi:hypothetical protein